MGSILGLLSAVAYGSADFIGGLASRRAGTLPVVLWSQAIGFGLLLIALPIVERSAPTSVALVWGGGAGLAGGVGVALLYRGLARGRMSAVAPITAVEAAAIPLFVGVALGERPSVRAWVGVALALLAVVLVSSAPGHDVAAAPGVPAAADPPTRPGSRLAPGVPEALGAGLAFGLWFVLLERAGDSGLWPLVGARVASVALIGAAALVARRGLGVVAGAWPAVAAAGVLDQTANALYLLAARRGLLSLVAVLTSLYPASTVLLARVVLHERFTRPQVGGLLAAAAGVALIATG